MTPEELAAIQATAESTSISPDEAAKLSTEGETKPASLAETVEAIVEEHRDEAPEDDKAVDSPTTESDDPSKNGQETEPELKPDEKEEPVKPELTAEEKAELEATFQQSERFQELTHSIEESKPFVEWAKNDVAFMQKHSITPDEWAGSRELLALSKTNPDEFWAKMSILREQYDISKGTKLPTDLQEAVDKQEISVDMAKKFAIQRLETQNLKSAQQLMEQRNIQTWQQTIAATANEWDLQKAKTDADFLPKKAGESDGKYEMVTAFARSLAEQTPPKNVTELRAILDKAYNQVDSYQRRFQPRTRVRARVLPNGSSSTASANGEPKNLQEAVQMTAGRKHGFTLGSD